MIVLALLLALAVACVLGAPRLLRLRRAAIRRPRLLLATWLGVFLLGAASIVGSVLWSVALALAARSGPLDIGWIAGLLAWGSRALDGARPVRLKTLDGSLATADVSALHVTFRRDGAGRRSSGATLPVAGLWTLTLDAELSSASASAAAVSWPVW